jgi:hypothetical protein
MKGGRNRRTTFWRYRKALRERIEELESAFNKNKIVTAYNVKDIEDLKNDAKHRKESDEAGDSRTETPVTININVDGVPVRLEKPRT